MSLSNTYLLVQFYFQLSNVCGKDFWVFKKYLFKSERFFYFLTYKYIAMHLEYDLIYDCFMA